MFLRGAVISAVVFCALLAGCSHWSLDAADREVYDLIESRQRAALGETHAADIGRESGRVNKTDSMYDFAPHPVDSDVPPAFQEATIPRPQASTQPGSELQEDFAGSALPDKQVGEPLEFNLADCLRYAQQHAREYQDAKEDLYLAALALSLERFLWTPQLSSEVSFEYANYGQVRDFDRAMTAVASLAAEQRLPLGGTVTAQVIDTWMRDLKVHTTSGETGDMILSADIPLLRGAGRVAYESRYQAERNLIYAVRDFEQFRRSFLVSIASDYFRLLSLRAQIQSAADQVGSLRLAWDQAKALVAMQGREKLDEDRARVQYLVAQNALLQAREAYGTAFDQFKIRLAFPPDQALNLSQEEIELYEPDVDEEQAIATALKYRLDLLNTFDAIDDGRRNVVIARNQMLPDFNFTGSVNTFTDPNKPSTVEYNTERTTWRGLLQFEVPLNRLAERNDWRASMINLRRAERAYDLAADQVRADVRRSFRRVQLARITMEIQRESITINEFRSRQAETLFGLGLLESNRDVIEAQNELRDAKNAFADALADYRQTILDFLRDTGTLRIDDDGNWRTFVENFEATEPDAG